MTNSQYAFYGQKCMTIVEGLPKDHRRDTKQVELWKMCFLM